MLEKIYILDDKPGSISNIYEIKILICRILNETNFKITADHINAVFQINELVNYFNFCQSIKELLDSGHILEQNELKNGQEKKYLQLTKIGKEAAEIFKNNI